VLTCVSISTSNWEDGDLEERVLLLTGLGVGIEVGEMGVVYLWVVRAWIKLMYAIVVCLWF